MESKFFIPNVMVKLVNTFKVKEQTDREMIGDEAKIRVNQVISKFSSVYEKLRNVVDYNDEHLLRKNAIFRILKRIILIEKRKDKIGLTLLQELIRVNYLPNNTLPESKAKEVEEILNKYLIINRSIFEKRPMRQAFKIMTWLINVAACEIEEVLFDFKQRNALILAMRKILQRDVELPDSLPENEQNILLQLTVLRSLMRSDGIILYHYLISQFYPNFFNSDIEPGLLADFTDNLEKIKIRAEYYINHPLRSKLWKISRRYSVYFLILKDVLEKNQDNIDDIIARPKLLADQIMQICEQRYKKIRIKVVRSVIRSIIYIFITKMFLAFLIEIPLDYLFEQTLNYVTLIINVLFPPFLMFAISLFIRLPRKKNTEAIIAGVKEIVYQQEDAEAKYHIKSLASRGRVMNFFFNLFYIITYGITFGIVIYILNKLSFSIFSGTIFIFFLCVVSFFAIHIRLTARELIVLNTKEGLINFLFDFFSLPIVRIGRWLSVKLSKINIFVFILDFIIEAPLKIILEVMEEWFSFIREKKEEVY
ncbi:MAG: hypothetical protein WC480_03390 [Patescibacteria group bacterium]